MIISGILAATGLLSMFKKEPVEQSKPIEDPLLPSKPQLVTSTDGHNMSQQDLQSMITTLKDSGKISQADYNMMSIDKLDLKIFGGIANDAKIDMISHLEQQIDTMKTSAADKSGIESVEKIVNILKGMDARSGASIPASV